MIRYHYLKCCSIIFNKNKITTNKKKMQHKWSHLEIIQKLFNKISFNFFLIVIIIITIIIILLGMIQILFFCWDMQINPFSTIVYHIIFLHRKEEMATFAFIFLSCFQQTITTFEKGINHNRNSFKRLKCSGWKSLTRSLEPKLSLQLFSRLWVVTVKQNTWC